jgi:cellulose synthase/poly-beta-1,6-N-acetylglucosamine synthase-like glycosyltransferase
MLTLNGLLVCSLFIIQALFGFLVGYLMLLTLASSRAKRQTKLPTGLPTLKFAILIPAHNEERLLPGLLQSLAQLDYPAHLVDIHVVADNCTDQTAPIAQSCGCNVHIRMIPNHRGKGPALQWLFERVQRSDEKIDAILILDADSIVSPDFLRIMATRLQRGEKVIQAYYAVRDPGVSWSSSLRFAAFTVLHFLRPLGRTVLGGSTGLKGNGMVFSTEIFARYPWSNSVTEDIELHMRLILDGERVSFAPDAVVLGEMPDTLANSESQHERWERGRIEMRRRYVPLLARKGFAEFRAGQLKQAYVLFDAIIEHLIPPFAIMVGLNLVFLLLNLANLAMVGIVGFDHFSPLILRLAEFNLLLSVLLLSGQVYYVMTGLKLIHATRDIYKGLLYSPAYLAWKVLQYSRVVFKRDELEWVRTRRNGV